jgi:hypothetical protein
MSIKEKTAMSRTDSDEAVRGAAPGAGRAVTRRWVVGGAGTLAAAVAAACRPAASGGAAGPGATAPPGAPAGAAGVTGRLQVVQVLDFHPDHNAFAEGRVTRTLYVDDQAEIRDGTPVYFVALGPLRVAVLTGGTVRFLHAPQGLHLYAFVANDPLNKTDPMGMTVWSVIGAVVGAIVGVGTAFAIIATAITAGPYAWLLGIGLVVGASLTFTGISYLIASNVDPNSAFGQFLRGFMIGFNAGMNGVFATAVFGPAIGAAVGVINFLAAFDHIADKPVYQGILGWTSWLMPMSHATTAIGVTFYTINLLVAGVTGQQWDAARIDRLAFDFRTGSFVMAGGLLTGLNRLPNSGFNLGNFVFITQDLGPGEAINPGLLAHETGHTLNVAAFGSAFHLLDWINQNAIGAGAGDYGERIAESHGGVSNVPMWS